VRSVTWIRVATVGFVAACSLLLPTVASATSGDLFPPGTGYCASTYPGHPRPFPKAWWGPSVDINRNGGDRDRPLLAPGDGKVLVWTTVRMTYRGQRAAGWGNSIVWISADGHEQIFVGHLDSILTRWPQQRVRSGQVIGVAGNTGHVAGTGGADAGAHLHVNRMIDWRPAPVVLSGRVVVPSATPGDGCGSGPHHYVSAGPEARRGACTSSPAAPLTRPTPLMSDPDTRWRWIRPKDRCSGA